MYDSTLPAKIVCKHKNTSRHAMRKTCNRESTGLSTVPAKLHAKAGKQLDM